MDYTADSEQFQILVETEKNRIKSSVLADYIALRKQRGITQQEIAERTGMMRTNVVRIESGKYVPTIEVLVKLAAALDMELEVRMVRKEKSGDD